MWIGKIMIIHLIAGLMGNILIYEISYFPEPYSRRKNPN